MIKEKMLELLLLLNIARDLPYDKENNTFVLKDHRYDADKYQKRVHELVEEFMSDYLIDSTSNEE